MRPPPLPTPPRRRPTCPPGRPSRRPGRPPTAPARPAHRRRDARRAARPGERHAVIHDGRSQVALEDDVIEPDPAERSVLEQLAAVVVGSCVSCFPAGGTSSPKRACGRVGRAARTGAWTERYSGRSRPSTSGATGPDAAGTPRSSAAACTAGPSRSAPGTGAPSNLAAVSGPPAAITTALAVSSRGPRRRPRGPRHRAHRRGLASLHDRGERCATPALAGRHAATDGRLAARRRHREPALSRGRSDDAADSQWGIAPFDPANPSNALLTMWDYGTPAPPPNNLPPHPPERVRRRPAQRWFTRAARAAAGGHLLADRRVHRSVRRHGLHKQRAL